ncbi:MAG: pilus assembly protein [Armatimonadetes bacterium]|nr:pilus assembly protein [Armatimonadota bacterium]
MGAEVTRTAWRKNQRGVVTVELALVAPVLMLFLFAAVELGALMADVVVLNAAARAGARSAAVGWPTSVVEDRIESVASSLDLQQLSISLQWRRLENGTWTAWTNLGNANDGSGLVNDAPQGAEIRVVLSYRHELLAPGIFGFLANAPGLAYRTIHAVGYMQRE